MSRAVRRLATLTAPATPPLSRADLAQEITLLAQLSAQAQADRQAVADALVAWDTLTTNQRMAALKQLLRYLLERLR